MQYNNKLYDKILLLFFSIGNNLGIFRQFFSSNKYFTLYIKHDNLLRS